MEDYICPHVDSLELGDKSVRYPPRWGPAFWKYLHMACIFYSKWETDVKKCITSAIFVIPCCICKDHATNFILNNEMGIETVPPFAYINNLHNSVNSANGLEKFELRASFERTVSWLRLPEEIESISSENAIDQNESEGSEVSLLPVLALGALLGGVIAYGYSRSNVARTTRDRYLGDP